MLSTRHALLDGALVGLGHLRLTIIIGMTIIIGKSIVIRMSRVEAQRKKTLRTATGALFKQGSRIVSQDSDRRLSARAPWSRGAPVGPPHSTLW